MIFNALSILLLGLAFIQPLRLLPWVSWHSEVLVFLALSLLSIGLFIPSTVGRRPYVLLPYASAPLLLLTVVVCVQYFYGQITFFGDALALSFYLYLCLVTLIIGFAKKTLTILPWVMVVVALVSTGIALTQALGVWSDLTWIAGTNSFRRPGGNLGQPNHLATLLLMGLASLTYLYESKRLHALLCGLMLVLLILGLAITESRSGLLGFIGTGAWLLVGRRNMALRTSPWAVLLAAAGLFGLLWQWPVFISIFHAGGWTSGVTAETLNTSAGIRLVVWPQLMDAALQRPWFGWGMREVAGAQNAAMDTNYAVEAFSYAHNIILDLAVGMGIPLTLLLLIVTAAWAWNRTRAAKTLLTWYCLALVLPLTVHSMLEFPFAYAYFLLPAVWAIGVLEAELAPKKVWRVPAGIAVSFFSVFTALMIWSAVEYVAVEEDFRVARFEALRVGHTPTDYERPRIVLLTQLDALLEGARIVPQPDMSAERLELSRKVAMRFPWTATQNRYALSLALNGHTNEAVRQLKVMRAMHGEKTYQSIKAAWQELARDKYPQLKIIQLPE